MSMSYPRNITKAFGGLAAMARMTGFPPSTIASWEGRGAIHDVHKPRILLAAKRNGVDLGPEDFFPDPPADLSDDPSHPASSAAASPSRQPSEAD